MLSKLSKALALSALLIGLSLAYARAQGTAPARSSGSAASYLCASTPVVLTNAQTKALPTTYIPLVAAPGASRMIILQSVALGAAHVAAEYTNVDNAAYILAAYGAWDVDASSPAKATNILSGSVASFAPLPMNLSHAATIPAIYPGVAPVGERTQVENVGLQLVADNNSMGDFTGGNAANTLTVTLLYSLLNTATGAFVACP